ncbi:MAG: DUF4906 domain-containing protein [Bacteroidales bacterium]|nr:DUF4906 domain-containing protein [Bacteroidales bacterium]
MRGNLFPKALVAVLSLIWVSSCTSDLLISEESDGEAEIVEVSFCADWDENTKSSISANVDAVSDYWIAAYRRGRIETVQHLGSSSKTVTMKLVRGAEYAVYALANVGNVDFPARETELASFSVAISKIKDLDSGIPMAWSDTHYVARDGDIVSILFERMVSEISFRLDPSAMDELEVVSVRLMQGATAVTPFGKSGSRAETAAPTGKPVVMDGDYASQSDLLSINAGSPITLYTLENCQGTLLPGNMDPVSKVPDNLSHPERCTYLEVLCRFKDESVMDGSVTYRLYPGEDDCTNFDLVRNHEYDLTLLLTPGGLREVSWRVENRTRYKLGLGSWKILQGLHDADDLYVGESNLIQVTLLPGLVKMLADELPSCSLRLVRSGVVSGDIGFGPIDIQGNVLSCVMKAEMPTVGVGNLLYLFGPDGKPISDLTHEADKPVVVRKARMRVSDEGLLRPVINGDPADVDLFLVDRQGRNLNSSASYGFDLGKYSDMLVGIEQRTSCSSGNASVDNAVSDSQSIVLAMGSERSDGPAARLVLSMENRGDTESLNRELSRLYGRYAANAVPIWDCRLSSSNAEGVGVPLSFDIAPIELWHCGSQTNIDGYPRSASRDVSDYRLVVSNPSGITLEGSMFYTGRHHSSLDALRDCSDVSFLAGDRSAQYDLVGSKTDFVLEPSRTVSYEDCTPLNPDTKQRKAMKSYHIQRTAAFTMSSPYAMHRKVVDYVGSNWQECVGDLILKTVGGHSVEYAYADYYNYTGGVTNASLSDVRYYSSRAWDAEENRLWSGISQYNALENVRPSNLAGIHGKEPVEFSVQWKEGSGFVLYAWGDQGLRTGNVLVDVSCELVSSLTWREKKDGALHYEYYRTELTGTYVLGPQEEQRTIMTDYGIENAFYVLNRDYWHQSTESGNLPRQVFAVFALPDKVNLTVTLRTQDNSLLPVKIRDSRGVASVRMFSLNYRTSEGSYPAHDSMTNPDSSSRGSVEAKNKAQYEQDYVKVSNKNYTYVTETGGAKTFHRYDR